MTTIHTLNPIRLLGMTVSVKTASAETGGAFCVVECTLPPHYRKDLSHWHTKRSEAFYVIDGSLTFTLDDQTFIAHCGSYVFAPPQTVHFYWNSTATPVTFLIVSAPGGLDCYLDELAAVFVDRPYDPALAAEIATHYDQYSPEQISASV